MRTVNGSRSLIIFTVLMLFSLICGQNKNNSSESNDSNFGKIAGQVVEESTGDPLTGVNIVIQGTVLGTTTNENGNFTLQQVPAGTYTVVASMIGYNEAKKDSIVVTSDETILLTFKLSEKAFQLKDVIVTPGYFSLMENKPGSVSGLGEADLKNFPQLGEDICRSVSRLPGLAVTDFSANFYVRGGEQDEVLILLDGMELFNPFHLRDFGGSLSVIDVEAIREIDMMTGAFPAEYGNRLSGVFNMKTKTPAPDKSRTSVALSFMNARFLSEGSLDDGKYRWQILARRGYIDFVLSLIGEDDSYQPKYYDVLGKVQYFINANHEISAHFLLSRDKLIGSENDLPNEANSELLDNSYGNIYGWINWNAEFTPKLHAETVLSVGKVFSNKLSQGYYSRILEYDASDNNEYSFFGIKQNWNYQLADWYFMKGGFDFKSYNAAYDYDFTQINWYADNSHDYSFREKNISAKGYELGLYFSNRFRIFNPLTAELGIRYFHTSWTGDNNWSPRLNLAYQLDNRTTLRTGLGMYYQHHAIDKLNMVDDDYKYYGSELSKHIVVGLQHEFLNGINFRVEGYYKFLSNIRPRYISYRYNTDTSPENSHDRLRIAPDEGKSTGVEFYIHQSNLGQFKWWLSYAYSIVENRVDGVNLPREMDQRHTVNLDLSYQPDENWVINLSWNYHSGWPYTEETVVVIGQFPDGGYNWRWAPGPLYGQRFPAYHRMDIRVSRYFETSFGRISLFAEGRNLYNRKNIRQYEYSDVVVFSPNDYNFIKEQREWLPLIPSFGISCEF